jgi:hypothetical protein
MREVLKKCNDAVVRLLRDMFQFFPSTDGLILNSEDLGELGLG